jgi:hydroxyacylglutathione hydrolase
VERFVKIVEHIYQLKVPFGNSWTGVQLVLGKENILVDTGATANDIDQHIIPALEKLGMSLETISWMIPTHIHGDHVGGCGRLREVAPYIRLAVYEDSLERMRKPLEYSKAIRARFPGMSAPAPKRLDGAEPDMLLKDGDKLGDLRLVFTPGHDIDSVSLFDERTGTLMTGDSLQLNGTISQGCALLMDVKGYARTLRRLMDMEEIRNIVAGHDYLPVGAHAFGRKASQAYLQMCAACYEHDKGFVHGMVAAGITDATTIAQALISQLKGREPEFLFLPLYTVTGFMEQG